MGTPTHRIDDVVRSHADLRLPRSFFAKEAPRHDVVVPSFEMSLTPVTVAQWRMFARATGVPSAAVDDRFPIDGLAWAEATRFCAWLTDAREGTFSLPTEEQWERAARGSDAREYPWGMHFDAGCANTAEAAVGGRTAVGSYPRGASPFGILDMAGNVDEWTSSPYAPYPGAPPDVPVVESWAVDNHITRGGDWIHHRDLARCARRHAVYPPAFGAGFRLVRT